MPNKPGQFEGQFWFYLMLVSTQDGLVDRQALLSAPLTTNVISLFNMTERQIQLLTFLLFIISGLSYLGYCLRLKNNLSRQ